VKRLLYSRGCVTASARWPRKCGTISNKTNEESRFDELAQVIRHNFEVTGGELEKDIAAHLEKLEKMGPVPRRAAAELFPRSLQDFARRASGGTPYHSKHF
jgi:hypothetical protein